MGLPCFVKPNKSGSSFGISKVYKEEELGHAKNMLINSIIGAVIIMISFGLVTGVVGFLTNINS